MIIADLPTNDIWLAGDTHQIEVHLTEEGVPIPLTGYTAVFTAKLSKDDADNAPTTIQKTLGNGIEFVDEANGFILITLDPQDTTQLLKDTTYVWDLQLSIDTEVFTAAMGTIKIVTDVTQI